VKTLLSALRSARSRLNDLGRGLTFVILEQLLPKQKDLWCFCTWNGPYAHTMDNPRAVFEEIKNDTRIIKVILRRAGQRANTTYIDGVNVICVDIESLAGAYYVARCKVIILGYALKGLCTYGGLITKRHVIVQLWHGIPLKRIARLFPGEHFWESETPKYAATVCSSPQDQARMAKAFAPTPNVWISGLPRNDLILKDESELPLDYQSHLRELQTRIAGRKFLLYAPTWRDKNSGIYPFSAGEWETLKRFLSEHRAAMGIRAHANRRDLEGQAGHDSAHPIFFVNDLPDVNVILRATDVLVTDYSSIYIDFLITGRPILNFAYDMDSYVGERGFLYDLDEAMVDAPFRTFEELLTRMESALCGVPANPQRYERVKALFHNHGDRPSVVVVDHIRQLART
jgi:CDP-glycerol glycerophosphotransferase (TagB/SpsB family)